MLFTIWSNYSSQISNWAAVFEIPRGVIAGFIATESSGKMEPPNPYKATGLMQVTPVAIYEAFKKWNVETSVNFPSSVLNILKSKVPELITSKTATIPKSLENLFLSLLQRDADFNIMCGTMVLRWTIERFSTILTGGQLNKAMVAYNASPYHKSITVNKRPIKNPIDTSILAKNPIVPSQSRAYLYKMLGVDGFLSLIYKDKAIPV